MKEKLYILFLFLLVAVSGKTQDFAPGPDAKNLAEEKNVTVDYATGIFHYTVPLYRLKSGDYELPISLDYIGKGMKVKDRSGLLDYNWTLNTGGIVTRTMRGGSRDEMRGYIWTENATTPLEQDARNVGLRNRDGESDIFTAVFNGKKVDFIIRLNKDKQIYALPLQQTDVRIESEGTSTYISGWTITDNNGDRYIYRQKEACIDVEYVNVSTSNGVSNSDYTSAWYLTRILPYNGTPIEFCYEDDLPSPYEDPTSKHIQISNVYDEFKMTYRYGQSMIEQPFDFGKYRSQFDSEIGFAKYCLEMSSVGFRWQSTDLKIANLIQYGQIYIQPLLKNKVKTNERIAGALGNVLQMAIASEKLRDELKNMAIYCSHVGGHYAELASSALDNAAEYIHAYLSETRYVNEKEISGGISYKILSPLPSKIIFPEYIVKFNYYNDSSSWLTSISLHNRDMERISSVSFKDKSFTFLDKDNKETSNIKFDYYEKSDFPTWTKFGKDHWGYHISDEEILREFDNIEGYETYSALNSLKKITLSDGGIIEIGYERNRDRVSTVGGIRLRSLVFSDKFSERSDTITYSYPIGGTSIYKSNNDFIRVFYGNFADKVVYDRVQPEGHPVVNMGNNGLYYPQVTETISGKGTNVYKYQVVTPSLNLTNDDPYWLNGLLKEKLMYDTNGKFLKRVSYTYDICANSEHKLPQMQPSNFYLDEKSVESFYRGQGTQYLSGEELYKQNIKPRLTPTNTDRFYNLQFGVKIVLKEEVEYRYSMAIPYCRTKYIYDNPMSMHPTRVVRIGSDSIERTEVLKRTMDMANSVDSVFAKMKEVNLLLPVVKSLTVIDGKLIGEIVYRYQADKESKMGSIAPVEILTYIPDIAEVYIPTDVDTLLFTHGESNYKTEISYQYTNLETSRMQVVTKGRIEQKGHAYDDYGKLILECDVTETTANDQSKGGRKLDMEDFDDVLGKLYYSLQSYQSALERCKCEVTDFQFTAFLNSKTNNRAIAFAKEILKKIPDLNRAKGYYQIIVANNYMEFNTFRDENERYIGLYSIYKDAIDFVKTMETIVHFDEQQLFDYLQSRSEGKKPAWSSDYSLKLTPTPDTRNLQLYILKGIKPVSGEITHSGGNTPFAIESTSTSNLKIVNIDLSKYMDIVSVKVNYHKGCYMALVPEGTIFKATSYNADGTVYARFDQTGNVEYYIYDASGRVIQVKDQHGNLLKTYEYNQLQN